MGNFKLTIVERTILMNQFAILSKLDDEDQDGENALKAEIVKRGIEYFYDEVLVSSEVYSRDELVETMDILEMCLNVEWAIEKLSDEQKSELDGLERLGFKGFDANNDKHHFLSGFLVDKKERFIEYKNRIHSSHSRQTLDNYRRQMKIFKTFKQPHMGLDSKQLRQLIDVAY